jgi:hypothetical protein
LLVTPQYIDIKWTNHNKHHYESLGYVFTKYREGILVNVVDLPKNSKKKISIQCDEESCVNTYKLRWDGYQNRKSREVDICPECRSRRKIINQANKKRKNIKYNPPSPTTLPLNSSNIEIQNYIATQFNKRDFYYLPDQTYVNNKKKLKYICLKHKDKGILEISWGNFNKGKGCKYCGHQRTSALKTKKFKDICSLASSKGYGILTLEQDYKNAKQMLTLNCRIHGEFKIKYNNLQQGQGCRICGYESMAEKRRKDFNEIFDFTEKRGYKLLIKSDEYKNSYQKLILNCTVHGEFSMTWASLYNGSSCPHCVKINSRGENHHNWKGGDSEVKNFLRDKIRLWKRDSMKNCNYKCIITGSKFQEIHHLYPFNKIVDITFLETNITRKSTIGEYTQNELHLLEEKCIEIHARYPLGVCLRKDIHKLFHSIYGIYDNTPEQFYEFKSRYYNDEFNFKLNDVS